MSISLFFGGLIVCPDGLGHLSTAKTVILWIVSNWPQSARSGLAPGCPVECGGVEGGPIAIWAILWVFPYHHCLHHHHYHHCLHQGRIPAEWKGSWWPRRQLLSCQSCEVEEISYFHFCKNIFQIDIHIRVACNVNKISQTSSQIDICIWVTRQSIFFATCKVSYWWLN